MKLLKISTLVFVMLFGRETSAQSSDMEAFIKKFDAFKDTPSAKLRWTKSPDASDNATYSVPMPNPVDVSKTHVKEPTTGLWHYPHIGKVYDPETGYFIDFDAHRYFAYRVDAVKGKIYKGNVIVDVKRNELENGD